MRQLLGAHLDAEASLAAGPGGTHRQPNGFPTGGRAGGERHLSLHGVAKVILEAPGGLGQQGLGGLYQAPAAAEVHFGPGGSPGGIPK